MKNSKIRVWQEGRWFLAEVVNRGENPFYAQGLSYEEVLSNLFAVIRTVREIDNEDFFNEKLPEQEINFSIPTFA